MSRLQDLQNTYWEIYKDVNGFRPRGTPEHLWNDPDWLEATIADLSRELETVIAREEAEQAAAIVTFEATVERLISQGADDRATAIRWLMQAEDSNLGFDHFCYIHNLPYGYFNKAA